MTGPFPPGTYTRSMLPHKKKDYDHLVVGKQYRVAREFVDHGKTLHLPGETWTFLGHNYHHMDEGRQLFVSLDGVNEWDLPLWGGDEKQLEVINYLEQYIIAVP